MYKKKLLATLMLFSFGTAKAQMDVRKVRFGAYIAPNISWMKPTATKDDRGEFGVTSQGSRVGYTWGLMMDYNFADNYAIVSGLQLNTTGGKMLAERLDTVMAPSTVRTADFDYKLQFIEVPLALKLRTDEVKKFRFFGQLGLTAGINIQKIATYEVSYIDAVGMPQIASGEKEKLKGSLAIAPVMLQMNIGAGFDYPLSEKLKAYLGLFFNNGFVPDATNPADFALQYEGEFRDANTRLNNFAFRVGLFF